MQQTRRKFLVNAGLAGGGIALGGVGGFLAANDDAVAGNGDGDGTGLVPFHGEHQAGILTPQQDRLHFAAFDLTTENVHDVRELLRAWTDAAVQMTRAAWVGDADRSQDAPPDDTGEAADLLPSRLTVTIGLGPTLFRAGGGQRGEDRFGLAAKMPRALRALPALPGDELVPAISGGDLCVQACADDAQVAFHAVRNLARIARGTAVMRWSQLGFGRTSSTSRKQDTPRNLMGFKDGTNNITAEDKTSAHREHLWADADDGTAWMHGGSYMVTRRIRMLIEVWDRASLRDQEDTIGRHKASGAPLGERAERDDPDFDAKRADGEPLIPVGAHVRLASPDNNDKIRMLRRGYSFTDGFDSQLGQLDAGLFFISYQRNPHKQFVPVQQRLGADDALNEYIIHRSSGLFAVPPGVPDKRGRFLGDGLFA